MHGSFFESCTFRFRDYIRNEKFYFQSPIFDDIVVKHLISILSPQWHSYREGEAVTLSTDQKNLAKSTERARHKVKGVAGSGKTQVLAARAVNAQIRTGGNILLLTFNITLVNYLKMRLSKIRADFPWNKIHIDYYHRFFKKYADKFGLDVFFDSSYQDMDLFRDVADNLPKFDAIFIDEVQDYMTEWLQIIRRYFLKDKGEFVVFGDPKQNIYERPLDKQGDIRLGIIPGVWNTLKTGYRFTNPSLAGLSTAFQNRYSSTFAEEIQRQPIAPSELNYNIIDYKFIEDTGPEEEIFQQVYRLCIDFIQANQLRMQDVAIIGYQKHLLQWLDLKIRKEKQCETTVTFERQEEADLIQLQSPKGTYGYKRDTERISKVHKNNFTVMTHKLKLSTIQSFKGWESPTIICIISNKRYASSTPTSISDLIYTGITRAKENLLIINIGNPDFHPFFSKQIPPSSSAFPPLLLD